jgi:hypothetical protein
MTLPLHRLWVAVSVVEVAWPLVVVLARYRRSLARLADELAAVWRRLVFFEAHFVRRMQIVAFEGLGAELECRWRRPRRLQRLQPRLLPWQAAMEMNWRPVCWLETVVRRPGVWVDQACEHWG